jgi:hypothetical protein
MTLASTVAYCDTASIAAVKGFIAQAPGACRIKTMTVNNSLFEIGQSVFQSQLLPP